MTAPTAILKKNLDALSRRDKALVEAIARAKPAELVWSQSKAGPLTASLTSDSKTIALASKYDPEKEAEKLTAEVDPQTTACVVMLGFGLGYHIDLIARGQEGNGLSNKDVLIIFEPDLGLLHSVLSKIDYSAWLGHISVVLAGPDIDRSTLLNRISDRTASLTIGTQLITHPASRQRYGEAFNAFSALVTETLAFCRTNVATALVNASRTVRNLSCNLPHYAAGATVNELAGAARGYPAVCVGAGPSLVKNIDLLCDPDIRNNVVLIGVQTTLKPMLDRGIRPDFITALDYSAICTRFYEDLPPLPDVTLVAEPKCNPAIIEAYPGPVRICKSTINDQLLGNLARPIATIKSGTTVAHLSFYLAQLLGCDPVIFIGQDLGFSDGLYYAPGTAVHNVWAPELGAFNTIETMEWTRIVRMRGHLSRSEDIHGRPIFTDDQMRTYLSQFERDFAEAKEAGQTIIDATEGGMPKQHTQRMTLREAIETHATRPIPPLPKPSRTIDRDRLREAHALLRSRLSEVRELRRVTVETSRLLKKLKKHQHNDAKMQSLFDKIQKNTRRVDTDLVEAFKLVSSVNTIGTFRRARADRRIAHGEVKDAYDQQLQQIERDQDNLDFIEQACDETLEIYAEADGRMGQALAGASAAQRLKKPKTKPKKTVAA